MATYGYQIGVDAGSRQNVEDLVGVPPRSEFHEYSVRRVGGDGIEEGDGFPWCIWSFDYLTVAMLNLLTAHITGQSGQVSIRTRTNDGTYSNYSTCVMHRPESGVDMERTFLGWRDVTIAFTRLRN